MFSLIAGVYWYFVERLGSDENVREQRSVNQDEKDAAELRWVGSKRNLEMLVQTKLTLAWLIESAPNGTELS